jgi:signal transduction histidine kinase
MALGIKTKQVAGVTFIVGLAVILLSAWYISSLATVWLGETRARAELLANTITHRAFEVVRSGADPVAALQTDGGLESILESSVYSNNVLYAAIVGTDGVAIAHSDPTSLGRSLARVEDLDTLLNEGAIAQARAIYTPGGKRFEHRKPLFLNEAEFGSVRIGVSTLLLQQELDRQMRTPLFTAAIAILVAVFVAMLLAQVTLRPIHVIRSGLARLGRGELDVSVDLPSDAELADLGDSFKAVSARLAADRSALAGQRATLESVVDSLEDAVALFSPAGALLFANPAMEPVLGTAEGPVHQLLAADHPYRRAVERALTERAPLGPATVQLPGGGERLLLVHRVENADGELLGVMLVARNLTYLSQVESTLSYSRKLAALGRLSAGIAHEVKNPLNATLIHLELLKMQLADHPTALEHVAVIRAQMRRLDDVVQGFLKFTRPEDLQLQPVAVEPLVGELMPVISAEASKHGVEVRVEFAPDLPAVHADPGLLQQAFLNLAINACQAMANGGRLRIAGSRAPHHQVAIVFEDTGAGIPPEQLTRIFDLYFTTKEHGSGIGLSLVYRTVQLHDGEIEVQSTPGRGTTFRVLLREASGPPRAAAAAAVKETGHLRAGRVITAP